MPKKYREVRSALKAAGALTSRTFPGVALGTTRDEVSDRIPLPDDIQAFWGANFRARSL